jgi:hypothetical protein
MALTLSVRITVHKESNPVHPVINNICAPTYKLSKYLTRNIAELIKLLYTLAASNLTNVASDLPHIKIKITTKSFSHST